jgi:acetyl esterase/lipase
LRAADIKGVIAISGVYRIAPGSMRTTLGGSGPGAFGVNQLLPLRGTGIWGKGPLAALPHVPLAVDVFGPAFGNNPEVRKQASPLTHVRPGLPPFLILYAEKDLPTLRDMAEEFHGVLVENGCPARLVLIDGRNHSSILFQAIHAHDPVAAAIRDFVWQWRGGEAAIGAASATVAE